MIKQKICAKKDCNRQAISLSPFCGQHTNNKQLTGKLNGLKTKKLKNLFFDEVEIKKLSLQNKDFSDLLLTNTDFEKVHFSNCTFTASNIQNTVFTNCTFTNCRFEQTDFTDVTFHETILDNCTFLDCRLSEIYFGDDSKLVYSNLEGCDFTGGVFSETGVNSKTRFLNNTFIQVSINRASFEECQFVEVTFSKTSLYESGFTNCHFDTITHDFAISGVPMLTDFRGTEFINMSIPRDLRKWNNLKKEPLDFYLGIVDWLTGVNHPNWLAELAVALSQLLKLGFAPTAILNGQIKQLFKRLAAEAASAGNYTALGDILSDFGRIPEQFRQGTGFMLPPPGDTGNGYIPGKGKLLIHSYVDDWTLQKITRFLQLLSLLEKELPPAEPQVIAYIEQGSIIVQIIGGIKQLFAGFRALLDVKNTRMDIKLKELDYDKKLLELQKQQIELEHLKNTKDIEYETAKLGLIEKKLDVLQKMEEVTGFKYDDYRKTPNGKKAEALGELIQAEFPVLQLKIEDK